MQVLLEFPKRVQPNRKKKPPVEPKPRPPRANRKNEKRYPKKSKPPRYNEHSPATWVGLDGEGSGSKPHKYVYLCAASADGQVVNDLRNWTKGLSSRQVLNFLCDLPDDKRYWAYSFGYDITCWLRDLPNRLIYELARPDTRRNELPVPHPRRWQGYKIQWNLTYFSLEDERPWHRDPRFQALLEKTPSPKTRRQIRNLVAIYKSRPTRKFFCWDIWKFYGFKFTKALKDWKVPVNIRAIEAMKALRGEFTVKHKGPIEKYCQAECTALGQLAYKLIQAHNDAGIELKSFFGAGSTAGAMLKQWGTRALRGETPKSMARAIASAFMGGRFENAVVGVVKGPIYGKDISSAYPYQCALMPCLLHGRWVHTKNRRDLDRFPVALIRYKLNKGSFKGQPLKAWGPFPFRCEDKSIVYPAQSGGGWTYQDEYLAAEKHFSGVQFISAYCWEQKCDCKPFSGIVHAYRERIRIGKEGAGLVFKNGPNAVYGKVAQSKGKDPPYQSWLWAGMITSNTRAKMISDVMNQLTDLSELLMIATDGCQLTRDLDMPAPVDTGTNDLPKPLGGWETKIVPQGCFYARPGIYFPLRPTEEEIDNVRARGMGRATLYKQNRHLVNSWKKGKTEIEFDSVRRFRGAITATSLVQGEYKRHEDYACWVEHPVNISLSGLPKRQEVPNSDNSLALRSFPMSLISRPYVKALSEDELNPEHAALEMQKLIDSEQPDGDSP